VVIGDQYATNVADESEEVCGANCDGVKACEMAIDERKQRNLVRTSMVAKIWMVRRALWRGCGNVSRGSVEKGACKVRVFDVVPQVPWLVLRRNVGSSSGNRGSLQGLLKSETPS